MRYEYMPEYICASQINFDLEGNVVRNVQFIDGCDGNLKAISKLVEGMTVEKLEEILAGNTCETRPTSCADQLVQAVKAAYADQQRRGAK